jgi:hypothetical protein
VSANAIAAYLASYDVTVTHNGPEALARASQCEAPDRRPVNDGLKDRALG